MLYPIKFIPRLKERLWGGHELLASVKAGKGATIDPAKCYGESWELSAVPGDESVVANGLLKKNTIEEIIEVYMGSLIGEKNYERYGLTFPLLIKSLDCHDVLSVQVHPNDELAAERHNSYGKTEMWYVSGCEEGAALYVGFKDTSITREEYLAAVNEDRLPEILNRVEVKVGDVFFIPAGTVHALGKGIEVLEIQQTSDVTYRLYDWNRVDDNGNPRELHTALAVDAIDFARDSKECIMQYDRKKDEVLTVGRLIEILKDFPMDSKVELDIDYYYDDCDYGKTSGNISSSIDYIYTFENSVIIEGDKNDYALYERRY